MDSKEDITNLLPIPFGPNDKIEQTERIAKLPLSGWQRISPLLAVRGVDFCHSIARLQASQIELNCSTHPWPSLWPTFWVHSCFWEVWEPDYRACGLRGACVVMMVVCLG
jgi:hypothetical protein